MKKEKILIDENTYAINSDLNFLDKYILPLCPAIQRAFENLELAELSEEYLKDILFNLSTKIESDLTNKLFNETPKFLSDQAIDSAIKAIGVLRNKTEILLNKCHVFSKTTLLEYITVSENKNIVFSANSKEQLKESHRTYVITPEGIKRRKLHEEACKVLNEFKSSMGDYSSNFDVFQMFEIGIDNDNVFPVPVIYE